MPQYDAGDIVYQIDGELSPLQRALAGAEGQARGMASKMADVGATIGRSFAVAGAAITGVLGVAVKSATDFGSAMAEVNSLGVKDLGALRDSVKDISLEFGINLTDGAKAAYQAISAGATEAQVPMLLAEAAKAATAGVADLTTSIELGTSVTNAFGGEIENVSTIYDQAFTAVKLGVTTFDELAGSIGRVSPLFAAAKLGSDEMFASITALTKGGIQTSEAVSGLKAALSNIIKPTSEATELAESLGIQFNSAALSSMGLAGFLDMVKTATGGNIDTMAQLFGSVEGLNVILALTGEQSASFNEALTEMRTQTGQTQEAFDRIVESDPSRAFALLWNQVQVLSVEIGEALLPALKSMLDVIAPIVQSVADWIRANPELIATIVTVTGAVGAFMLATGPLLIALPGIVSLSGLLAGAFAALAGPVGILAVAIGGGLAVAFQYAGEIVDWFKANWDSFATIFSEAWETVRGILNVIGEVFNFALDGVATVLSGFVAGATGDYGLMNVAESFKSGADSIQAVLQMLADAIKWFHDFWNTYLSGVVEYTGYALGLIASAITKALQAIGWVAGTMGDIFNWLTGPNAPVIAPPPSGETPQGKYKGGKVRQGQLVTVGEIGPELFVPNDLRTSKPGLVGERGAETGRMPASGFIYTASQTAALGRIGLRSKPLYDYDTPYQDAVLKAVATVERLYGVSATMFLRAARMFHPDMIAEYKSAGLGINGILQMTDATARAMGGPVVAGRPYIVGEHAPEVFVPRQDGTILNQQQLAAVMGGGGGNTVNATINVHAAPGMDIDRLANEIDRRLYRLTRDANRRQGSPALAMG